MILFIFMWTIKQLLFQIGLPICKELRARLISILRGPDPRLLFDCIAWKAVGLDNPLFDSHLGVWPATNYQQLPLWKRVLFQLANIYSQWKQQCITDSSSATLQKCRVQLHQIQCITDISHPSGLRHWVQNSSTSVTWNANYRDQRWSGEVIISLVTSQNLPRHGFTQPKSHYQQHKEPALGDYFNLVSFHQVWNCNNK